MGVRATGSKTMIHSQRVVALVPIKEHSERVKGKNFRDFCGKPLYHHILHTLERTYAVDEIVVDTDSPRVMQETPEMFSKARVVERPAELRGDFVSMNKILAHDLTVCEGDVFLQTHATNPLLKLRGEPPSKLSSRSSCCVVFTGSFW